MTRELTSEDLPDARERERARARERERKRARESERERDRQRERQRERERKKERERDRERETHPKATGWVENGLGCHPLGSWPEFESYCSLVKYLSSHFSLSLSSPPPGY